MIIGVLKEPAPENRVSLVPEIVSSLVKMNITIWVEPSAGARSFYNDSAYIAAGAQIKDKEDIINEASLILTIHADNVPENTKAETVLMGVYQPLYSPELMHTWAERGYTVFSLDTIPRSTRAQAMDV